MKLTLSVIPSALTWPILEGLSTPRGVELKTIEAQSVDKNSRSMLSQEFDIAEMSFATYIKSKEEGAPLIGLPVFTGRRFLQPSITLSSTSRIQSLYDLNGCKIGVPQFWMTSSIWHRGLLQHEYGVVPEDNIWYTVANERLSSMKFPSNIENVFKESEVSELYRMLIEGEIDVVLTPKPYAGKYPDQVTSPFDHIVQAQHEYYARTELFPIMHFIVMREELTNQFPNLAEDVYHCFLEAKQSAYSNQHSQIESPVYGETFEEAKTIFNKDPWSYGIKHNLDEIDTFLDYSVEQGLLKHRFKVDELFAVK